MMKKQGITLTTVVVTVIILIILATAISVSTYSTLNYARLSTWVNEISHIQDVVNEARATTSTLPYTSETVTIDTTTVSSEQINVQFAGENIVDNKVELNILNLGVLKITNTVHGNLDSENDVYAYSTTTGKVYYAAGIEIDGEIYYTFIEALRDRFNLAPANSNLSSVVFVPSVIGYTNEPITLTVKLPNSFSNISITTSNNQIEVGTRTIEDNIYKYIINNNKIAGNYEVTVSYSDGTQSYTTKYTVNSYDTEKPEIAEITEENFVTVDNVPYITGIQAIDATGIKYLKYTPGVISEADAKIYFSTNGNNVINGKINLSKETTEYTIYAEDNAGNIAILSFNKTDYMLSVPEEWKENVTAIVDGVPIPKGFVASPYGANGDIKAENTKAGGLVIYELDEGETAIDTSKETQYDSWTKRNQYVWVPVAREDFTTKFIMQDFGLGDTYSDVLGEAQSLWEVVLNTTTNMPLPTQNNNYVSSAALEEVQEMYASVKKYEGFYIARYEAGIDNQRTSESYKDENDNIIVESKVYSAMGKIPYTYIHWGISMSDDTGGAVELARSIYPKSSKKYGVVSTLTYSVQWDTVLQWWLDTNAVESVKRSTSYGNYKGSIINTQDLNAGTKFALYDESTGNLGTYSEIENETKNETTCWALSTGALKASKVNNIYDMAGNMYEWTMGGYDSIGRVDRGGFLHSGGTNNNDSVAWRTITYPYGLDDTIGFRLSLYIKQ